MSELWLQVEATSVNLDKSFIKNVLVMASGAAAAQVITLLSAPFITRLYGPEAFGTLGIFIALLSVLIPIASLTLPHAIVIAESEADVKLLESTSLSLVVISSLILWGGITIISFNDYFGSKLFGDWLFLLPLALITNNLHQVAEQKAIRSNKFTFIAKMALAQTAIFNFFKLVIGFLWPLTIMLIIIQSLFGLIWSVGYRLFGEKNKQFILVSFHQMASMLSKYNAFVFYRAPEVAISAASQGLPVIILSSLVSVESGGYFSLSMMLLSIPAALIGKAVGDSFYPRLAQNKAAGLELYPTLKSVTFTMAKLGLFPFVILSFFGGDIYSTAFGAEWRLSGEYASWLSMWVFTMFLNLPAVKTMTVIGEQKILLYFTVFTLLSRGCVALYSCMFGLDDFEIVAAFGVTGMIINMLLIGIAFVRCKEHDGRLNG